MKGNCLFVIKANKSNCRDKNELIAVKVRKRGNRKRNLCMLE